MSNRNFNPVQVPMPEFPALEERIHRISRKRNCWFVVPKGAPTHYMYPQEDKYVFFFDHAKNFRGMHVQCCCEMCEYARAHDPQNVQEEAEDSAMVPLSRQTTVTTVQDEPEPQAEQDQLMDEQPEVKQEEPTLHQPEEWTAPGALTPEEAHNVVERLRRAQLSKFAEEVADTIGSSPTLTKILRKLDHTEEQHREPEVPEVRTSIQELDWSASVNPNWQDPVDPTETRPLHHDYNPSFASVTTPGTWRQYAMQESKKQKGKKTSQPRKTSPVIPDDEYKQVRKQNAELQRIRERIDGAPKDAEEIINLPKYIKFKDPKASLKRLNAYRRADEILNRVFPVTYHSLKYQDAYREWVFYMGKCQAGPHYASETYCTHCSLKENQLQRMHEDELRKCWQRRQEWEDPEARK